MSDWAAGYVAEIGYTYGYYHELNPLRFRLALLNKGFAYPEVSAACELGYGQGLSLNIHASSSATSWFGTDFNPAQADFAQHLARAAGTATGAASDDSFLEFAQDPSLPTFDFIGLHGIWSWVSDDNRKIIVDFVRKKLRVGGVLYISYNTLPGWANFVPVRQLMYDHSEMLSARGGDINDRIDGALDFVEKIVSTGASFNKVNPQILARIKKLREQDRNYLAHEFFNRDWQPMLFSTVAALLEGAKVQYGCSAHYLDHIDPVNLTDDQQAILGSVSEPTLRETTRDFFINQQFRRDYWVKGLRRISVWERMDRFREQRVVLTKPRSDVALKFSGALGEANMAESIYLPILDLMGDLKVRTIQQIAAAVMDTKMNFEQLIQAVMVLVGTNNMAPAHDDASIGNARRTTAKLNKHICKSAELGQFLAFLASPVTGGGHTVSRTEQLFLNALAAGRKKPTDWAEYAWQIIGGQGQALLKDGEPLDTVEKNVAELNEQARAFDERRLPVLKVLQIA